MTGLRHAVRGFTLIEVLIALAVLAISMVAVIGAAGKTTRTASQLRDDTFASWVAMNELTSLRLTAEWPSNDSLNGDADMAGRKWHWKATISKTEDPDLLRIDVDVSDPLKPDDVITGVTGFMGRPRAPAAGLGGAPNPNPNPSPNPGTP
jgi:general secretion pathway protein I